MSTTYNAAIACRTVDRVFNELLAQLGCNDGTDANMISHWQEGDRPGFRVQVTSKLTGKTLTRFAGANGIISV